MGRVKILDANVVIAFMEDSNALHGRAVELLDLQEDEQLLMHETTMAEVLVGPAGRGDAALDRAYARLIEMQIERVGTGASPADVAKLRARTGLPIPDCLVILTAAPPDDDTTILTFDQRLAGKARELGYAVAP